MGIAVRFPRLEDWKAQVKCQSGCPVATDAGRYVQLIADSRDEDAYLVARAPNPFASVCGRVCAAPCEDACRRGSIDAPIAIRALKRFVTEKYGVESKRPDTQDRLRQALIGEGNRYAGHLPVRPLRATRADGRPKVAVIGAGPSGLSGAHDLALLGYEVTVFEAAGEPGGMMRFGIPEYRLPRTLIRAEIDKVLSLGVTLRLGTPLSPDFGLAELRRDGFAAVFLSVGVSKGRDLQVPGVELDGIVKAVDYLLNVNRGFRLDLAPSRLARLFRPRHRVRPRPHLRRRAGLARDDRGRLPSPPCGAHSRPPPGVRERVAGGRVAAAGGRPGRRARPCQPPAGRVPGVASEAAARTAAAGGRTPRRPCATSRSSSRSCCSGGCLSAPSRRSWRRNRSPASHGCSAAAACSGKTSSGCSSTTSSDRAQETRAIHPVPVNFAQSRRQDRGIPALGAGTAVAEASCDGRPWLA
jgi:hypothetical protein